MISNYIHMYTCTLLETFIHQNSKFLLQVTPLKKFKHMKIRVQRIIMITQSMFKLAGRIG